MFWKWSTLFLLLSKVLHMIQGCQIDDITNWSRPIQLQIFDIQRGIIFNRQTSDIDGIQDVSFMSDPPLNAGPYFNVSIIDSEFIIETNEEYISYEENETRDSVSLIVNFACSTGSTGQLVILIGITDTNNNPPQFQPSDVFEFSIIPPVPPGFLITDCLSGILVRDIDLTTQRIDFTIEENSYFAIESSSGATNPKEFESVIKTTTLIRSLLDPIVLTISATDVDLTEGPPITTNATIRITANNTAFQFPDELVFSETLYFANYTNNYTVELLTPVYLIQGYDDFVSFELDAGEYLHNFDIRNVENNIYISVILPLAMESITAENIFLKVKAYREYTSGSTAVIVLQLPNFDTVNTFISFDKPNYIGTIENNISTIEEIILHEGYNENIRFTLHGDLSEYFDVANEGRTVNLSLERLIPENLLPSNNIIILEIHASALDTITAYTTIIFELIRILDTPVVEQLEFDNTYYVGSYSALNESITMDNIISLSGGYDETVEFEIMGEAAQWIKVDNLDNVLELVIISPIPNEVILNNQILIFIIRAQKTENTATATVVLSLRNDSSEFPISSLLAFDKVLYNGIIQNNVVQHDIVNLLGHTDEVVEIIGEFAYLFDIKVSNEIVEVERSTAQFPNTLSIVALELHASEAKAVLLLRFTQNDTDPSSPPTVMFSSQSFVIQANVAQTGFVGQVFAISDNGEAINFSLLFENEYLQQRISIDNTGLIHLSATVESGIFDFQVIATTIYSQVNGTAQIRLIVEAITVCGTEDNLVVPPLLVINRDEEEIHENLAPINYTDNCHYVLTNRWPQDQTWLYVNEQGLHSRAIDREHPSIAHMALSQVQVELMLYCDNTEGNRMKRSANSARPDWLNQYDYGTYEWVLAETIQYNSRRMLVNLIVNDINDNSPTFIGKDDEPIIIGYPVADLLKSVSPRGLTIVQATDADVGENAALLYWSSEPALTVSQNTGLVHVCDNAVIEDEQLFVVNATDQNGAGLTGSIQLKIKTLSVEHIAVITVQNIYLDDADSVLSNLSIAVGYDVKILNSVIAPEDGILSQKNNNINKIDFIDNTGISIRLFVYGLYDGQPVTAERLIEDLRNIGMTSFNIINSLSLKDHLETNESVGSESNTGLLVSTIILSIVLFIIVAIMVVWFYLKWKNGDNYKKFSTTGSVVWQNEVLDNAQSDPYNKPRMNIEQLRQSERSLQSMLDSPDNHQNDQNLSSIDNKENISLEPFNDNPIYNPQLPTVIQSIDKLKDAESEDDEFGEIRNNKPVVTFNENVKKIIHLEDMSPGTDADNIYKF